MFSEKHKVFAWSLTSVLAVIIALVVIRKSSCIKSALKIALAAMLVHGSDGCFFLGGRAPSFWRGSPLAGLCPAHGVYTVAALCSSMLTCNFYKLSSPLCSPIECAPPVTSP